MEELVVLDVGKNKGISSTCIPDNQSIQISFFYVPAIQRIAERAYSVTPDHPSVHLSIL